jgi:hypothetical protein
VHKVENKAGDDANSSEQDEEYLMELEKNMPDEEKQKREESTRLKEEGNKQFKKGDYVEVKILTVKLFRCAQPASIKTGLFCFK